MTKSPKVTASKDAHKKPAGFAEKRSERVRNTSLGRRKENRLLIGFLVVSTLAHILVFYGKPEIHKIDVKRFEAVDVDLGDFLIDPLPDKEKPKKVIAIKKQKTAKEATIPSNMLPQLAKKIKMKEKSKEKAKDSKKNAEKKEEKKKAKKKDVKPIAKEDLEANALEKAELKKRLALEKLRKSTDVKKSKELKVQSDKQNKIDEEALKLKQEQLAVQREEAKDPCTKFIKQFVKPMIDEQLPVKYKFGDRITVDYLITPAQDLSIEKIAMEKTSEDDYFDQIVESALVASAPLPEPCRPFIGTQIRIRFSSSN